jgi:hypothetical protein
MQEIAQSLAPAQECVKTGRRRRACEQLPSATELSGFFQGEHEHSLCRGRSARSDPVNLEDFVALVVITLTAIRPLDGRAKGRDTVELSEAQAASSMSARRARLSLS